jgi:hypothetical protein
MHIENKMHGIIWTITKGGSGKYKISLSRKSEQAQDADISEISIFCEQ